MTDRPKRGRGPGRPVLENLKNAGPLLRPGEATRTHRVRAPAAVQDWWGSMTAEQRGEVLVRLLAAGAPAEAEAGQGASVSLEALPRPAQGQGRALRLSGVVPEGLTAYAKAVVTDLDRGGVLVEDGSVYRLTVNGATRTVRADTVFRLLEAGVLLCPKESS